MEPLIIEKSFADGGHCKFIILNPERLEEGLDRVRRAHWDRIKGRDFSIFLSLHASFQSTSPTKETTINKVSIHTSNKGDDH